MSAEYDPDADFVPPRKQYADDILVDDVGPGGLGRGVPFWKVLLWRTASARTRARVLNDAAEVADQPQTSTANPEDQPPPLVADAAEPKLTTRIDPQLIEAMEQAIDALTTRLDKLEAERRAEATLTELEDAIEKEVQQSSVDCDTIVH
jgi:hypothetical protein